MSAGLRRRKTSAFYLKWRLKCSRKIERFDFGLLEMGPFETSVRRWPVALESETGSDLLDLSLEPKWIGIMQRPISLCFRPLLKHRALLFKKQCRMVYQRSRLREEAPVPRSWMGKTGSWSKTIQPTSQKPRFKYLGMTPSKLG